MAVEEKVKNILLDILDVDESQLLAQASLMNDLGASSVDLVEIMAAVEKDFDVEIGDDDAPKLRTVGALIDYIKASVS